MTANEYNQCVDAHADGLYRFILNNIRDEEEARDIVQDAFEKMWRSREQVDGNKAKSYLFTTGHHTMIDRIRRRKFSADFSDVTENTVYHEEQYSDLKQLLNRAVSRLPDVQRAVLTLRDYEGYSYAEIGSITGLSESQVKVYIYRARNYLREYIGSLENVI